MQTLCPSFSVCRCWRVPWDLRSSSTWATYAAALCSRHGAGTAHCVPLSVSLSVCVCVCGTRTQLLEQLFATGLSDSLMTTLTELSVYLPTLLPAIQGQAQPP
jgi:hypothetical protein